MAREQATNSLIHLMLPPKGRHQEERSVGLSPTRRTLYADRHGQQSSQ